VALVAVLRQRLCVQIVEHRLRPGNSLGVEQAWRPASPKDRATSNAEGEAAESDVAVPWESPHLADASDRRDVLAVLGGGERSSLQNENAFGAARAAEEEVLRDCAPERSAADDDEVEWAHVAARRKGI